MRLLIAIINPKPWKMSDPTNAITKPISHVATLPSKIGAHDLSYAVRIAGTSLSPRPISSWSLSKIKILLSTPIPIVRMIAAIPDRDSAYHVILTNASSTTKNVASDTNPIVALAIPYIYHNNANTRISPKIVAYPDLIHALAPSVGASVASLDKMSGAGSAHSLRFATRHAAHSIVSLAW
jgi:hypothetical protein